MRVLSTVCQGNSASFVDIVVGTLQASVKTQAAPANKSKGIQKNSGLFRTEQ